MINTVKGYAIKSDDIPLSITIRMYLHSHENLLPYTNELLFIFHMAVVK